MRMKTAAIVGIVLVGLVPSAGWSEDWTRFGGPNADFSVTSPQQIKVWSDKGPQRAWQVPLGTGHSAVVANSEVVIGFFRPPAEAESSIPATSEVAVALAARDGSELWRHQYEAPARKGHLVQFGLGPHATPLLLEDRVILLGYTGELRALDLESGDLLWRHHLLDDLGGAVLPWGYSASPILINGDLIVLVGGSKAGVMAFDPADGAIRWQSEPTSVSYATPIATEVEGHAQLIYFASDALHGIRPTSGKALWRVEMKNGYENHASMPVVLEDDRLWVVSQQEAAARLLQLKDDGSSASATTEWTNNKVKVHYWNTLHRGATVFASTGDSVQVLAAVDLASGKVRWRERSVGRVNFLQVDDQTLALSDDGELMLIELADSGVAVKARSSVLDGAAWTAPTWAGGGRLYLRDQQNLVALDLQMTSE